MVDRAELFRIADGIVGEGREPSQRAIRERLARGGSFSDIGPLFVEWSIARGFRPRPRAEDLPQHLRDRVGTVAADIWADGLRNGAIAGQNERDRLVAERDVLRLALAEMTAIVDVLQGVPRVGPKTQESPENDVEQPARRRKDTIAFWDRVMQEIVELMEGRSFRAEEIFRLLDERTAREAPRWTEKKWCPSFLADKMRGRAKERKFFEEPKPHYFRPLGNAAPKAFGTEGSLALATTAPEPPPMPGAATAATKVTPQALARPSLRRIAAKPVGEPEDEDTRGM